MESEYVHGQILCRWQLPGILFPVVVVNIQYVIRYLFGNPIAFWKCSSIDHAYLYGISITHGIPCIQIWRAMLLG